MTKFEKSVIPKIGKLSKEFTYLSKGMLKKNGVTLTRQQFIVLMLVAQKNGCPQNDLAVVTERNKASLARLIASMERKGLIERSRNQFDKRIFNVFVTQQGRMELERTKPILDALTLEIQKGIPKEEIEITRKVLYQMIANINQLNN